MSDLYLIAHKVRGEPAFDVAQRCEEMGTASDPGPWWIIPTSGHRAYPYWHTEMNNCFANGLCVIPDCPPNWPDHYSCNDKPIPRPALSILEAIGLKPKVPADFKRRA